MPTEREPVDIIGIVAEKKGVSPDEILSAADYIAYHETGGSMKPSQAQVGGGSGRGLYQYEVGKDASAVTALNRLHTLYKDNGYVPAWVEEALDDGDEFDPSELSAREQTELFAADHLLRPNSDFSLLKTMPLDEWWGRFHQTENDPQKRALFRAHMEKRHNR